MTDLPPLLRSTRRHFFERCGIGLGSMALGSILGGNAPARDVGRSRSNDPLAPRPGHLEPRAKRVIYLFMAGGPSQLELFDHKPELQRLHNQPIPSSYLEGKRFAFMDTFAKEPPRLLGTRRAFARHGDSGAWVSECLPHTARVADDLTFVKSVWTEPVNHAPAKLYMNSGTTQFGRPSMGAWLTYGIGSEADDLPGFVVLQSGPRGPRGGSVLWGSGFLPTAYQGVPFRNGPEPILDLSRPEGVSPADQAATLDAIGDLNRRRLDSTGDPEIATRIASYEMAFRMQTSAPELIDLSGESKATLDLYGVEPGVPSFATNCLLARRLVERGTRFVQLYHTNWDHHGGPTENLEDSLDTVCRDVDRACAALVTDLKARGLLQDTLVIWGGEFGRTPMGEVREKIGRNHHPDAFTMWMAGGGVKPGLTLGETDEFGFSGIEDRVHVHDLQATILHLLGLDHTRLTYRFQGRDFRLTDVGGRVVEKLLA
ncbi:DUF1501 domain-containing protein [Tautonia sociabilis]|uniref:DUF1501 domain-containing protein n=1 Tax=Tautonia sociabilis TaxID=2080755 RepID=A0A432MPS3_9BACT|nr:DUF1501 domain-containing protein [Tautonia sociabilis]RUL89330.1 DUF1501 domain-containing protein [Tautonia sociabilis]